MRIAHPCSENLPGMARVPGGVHCTKCDRDVLDLRRVPKKRALAVLAEARATGDGRVCAWVRASPDGTPVFTPDPSRFARLAAPAVMATALAACSTSAVTPHESTPIAFVQPATPAPATPSSGGNTNAPASVTVATTTPAPYTPPIQPASNLVQPEIEMAGDMAF